MAQYPGDLEILFVETKGYWQGYCSKQKMAPISLNGARHLPRQIADQRGSAASSASKRSLMGAPPESRTKTG
jgi:hypothetical protein